MTIQEVYEKTGSDYNEVVACLGSEAMVHKYALKFMVDDSFQKLRDAILQDRKEEAFRASHTLKGLALNLCFTKVYEAAAQLTEQLRPLDVSADPVLWANLTKAYDELILSLKECD